MGRNWKNKSSDFFINNSSNKQSLTHVKIPFFNKITFKEKIGKHYDGSPHYANGEIITNKPIPKDMQVVKSEQVAIRLYDLCPNCNKIGKPRIDKKPNNIDYHYRVGTKTSKTQTNRPDEYFLVYDHRINGKVKKCKVTKFDPNHGIFIKKGRFYDKIVNIILPYCVKPLRRELRDFDSFQEFSNRVHL